MKRIVQGALDVQDACNLTGVVHSFAKVMSDLLDMRKSTDWANQHPVAVLYADKIAHLTRTQHLGNDRVMDAYNWAHKVAKGEQDPDELPEGW